MASQDAFRRSPRRKRPQRRQAPINNPFIRMLLGALCIIVIVALCAGINALTPPIDLETLETPAPGTPTPVPTPTPEPTITPTPAIFAPFGAQYGHGGEELIPQTPPPAPQENESTAQTLSTPKPTASPQPTKAPPRTLKKGMKGEDVRLLQYALIDLGYLSDAADGAFGSNTQQAVTLFQAVNGLDADGLAGAKTQEVLFGGHALSAEHAPKMDYLVLVNRKNALEKNYVPSDLVNIADVIPSSILKVKYKGTQGNRIAVEALGRMLEDAVAQGISNWQVSSAYRSHKEQQALIDQSVKKYQKNNPSWSREKCLSATYNTVSPVGTSEHQTGLAFDITVPGVSFTGTEQQKWLHKHCYEYGFIVRYTEEKHSITGVIAESWHFRYVGIEAAQVIAFNDWCLEEYVEKMGIQ